MRIFPLVTLRAELISYLDKCVLNTNVHASLLNSIKLLFAKNTNYFDSLSDINSQYADLSQQHQAIIDNIRHLIEKIEIDIINTLQHHTIQKDLSEHWSEELCQPLPDSMVDDALYVKIHNQLQKYMDWHYPGLIINTRFKKWVDCLLATDPLYLTSANNAEYSKVIETMPTDTEPFNKDYLERPGSKYYLTIESKIRDDVMTVIDSYSDLYKKRLRIYPILNKDYSVLPQGQFGIILAMETFNYLGHHELERYLRESFSMLRSGGTLVFNFWDCDIPAIAKMFDEGGIPYAGRMYIHRLAKSIGYDSVTITEFEKEDKFLQTFSLAELKKPGEINTSKRSQSVGRLIEK